MGRVQRKVSTMWCNDLAYAIGLITADGCLNKDRRHIWFSSKDLQLIETFKKSLHLSNKIGKYARGGETEKRYYCITFGDIYIYRFLNDIDLTPAKSKTIKRVKVPRLYFPDFLRGLFDGDGTFYTFRDKRWPSSFSFKLSIASASLDFLTWLKNKLTQYYSVMGYLHKGSGVWNLEYVKGDTKKLFSTMYYPSHRLRLNRKYRKIKDAIEQDKYLGLPYLQKPRRPE
ncbi:MAG: hypothetical protein HYT61_00305 [Candidatus Yanofskybacteria bacterium]|nr:hypothetical protein [Candidatus Yanofskybacteria bacterium]